MAQYYQVTSSISAAPLAEHLLHGYETRRSFREALSELVDRWHGRIGECIDERHGFLLLRFHDTPGGSPDEAWLPSYLLRPVAEPDHQDAGTSDAESDALTKELDSIFGFD